MERLYFFTKMRVVLLLSFFTLSFSFLSNAQEYALEFTQQNGIDGPVCILGAPDGYGAQFWTDGDYIIVRMTSVIPAGSQYFITWRMRGGETGNARPYLYESSNGSSFNENPGANTTSSTSWSTSGYTATQNFEYLKILKQSPNTTDFDIDAVSYCPAASQANLISSCEITGYASSTGRVFYLPNFGTDFKPSGEGLYLDKFDNGTAHLRGEISRISNANAKFLVSIWFNGESDYDEWLAQGRLAHSPNLGDESTWTYYSFDENMPNTLIGLSNYDGEVLYIEDTGSGYGLQLGDGANALNTNASGISTWFDYTGTTSGAGDINGTFDCGSEVVTCEITGYESTNGRSFYIPNFGTDFKAASSGLYLDQYSNGTAHLRGQIVRISNSNKKFDVSLWFNNKSSYAEWISQGLLAHSPNLGDESTWTFYSFDANMPNTLTGVSGLAGEVLNVVDTGSGYGLQIGNGANALTTANNGISTWFDYSGTTSGAGDINGTITCEPVVCNNVTSPGSICCDQTGCSPFNPNIISNLTLPSGGSGALEYVWLSNTTAGSINGNEQVVAGANGQSYDPGMLSQTTWFRRCARRAGCSSYDGETNWIKITVESCPVSDWFYSCEDGIEVEIIGEGIQDAIPTTLDLSPANNIDHVVVEAVYKSCNPGSVLNFVDQNGDLYPATREVPSGTSSNVWVYRTTMPATSTASIENQNNEWCAQSFTAYVFRQNGGGTQSSGVFTSRSGYNDIETVTISIPTDPNNATRNLTVELPISELTADGRYIYVSASAGGVTNSFSERIWDFGTGNCCYKLYSLLLNDVPGTASEVVITVDTRHNVHQPANGQSWVLAGAIRTDVACAECDVQFEANSSPNNSCDDDCDVLCFESTEGNDDVSAQMSIDVVNNGSSVTIRTTYAKTFCDNTYGSNTIGWPSDNHTFNHLKGSDKLELSLFNGDGTKSLQFKLDYIHDNGLGDSGYATGGVSDPDGDGDMIVGDASSILDVKTSLSENFNTYGYVLTTNSPATDANYTPNPLYPNWIYEVWYEVTVDLSAFGDSGFGYPEITDFHASPSKTGNNSEPVEFVGCCGNGCNGSIDLTVTAGSSPFTFLWSNGETTEDIDGLCEGEYSVVVTDSFGCSHEQTFLVDSEEPVLEATAEVSSNAICGQDDVCDILCFESTEGNDDVSAQMSIDVIENDNSITIRTTYAKTFCDNTYGSNTIGWPSDNHTFNHLKGSDKLELSLFNGDGTKSLQFKLDYIHDNGLGDSGYATGGVSDPDGDGDMIVGDASSILDVKTSLSENFNTYGYVLTTNSPATDANYTPNPLYPNWIYEVWYEVTVDLSAFGNSGFGYPEISDFHASPSKTGNNSEPVEFVGCCGENDCNGSIDLTVNIGEGPYTFLWSNGETTEDINDLCEGTYTVIITDGNGCSHELSFDVDCAPDCELECADDVSLECDANTHPDYTGYPTVICDENIDCARPEGDFDFADENFSDNAPDWNFGTGWLVGNGCAPSCGSVPNAFIDYSSFYTAYDTKLTSSLFDACCTDEVELSFCLRQDLYGSSNVPGYLDIQYRILGGSWQTVHTYTSVYGSTIDYSDSYALPVIGQQFEVRFRARGNGSANYTMGGWGLDNIHISAHSPGCAPSPVDVDIDWSWNDVVVGTCPQTITRSFEGTYNGELFECDQTITITDDIPPVFYMADEDATYACPDDIEVSYAFAMDNCDDNVEVTSEDHVNGSGCSYTIDRVFTAVDDCGNEATYTQIITINDNIAPTFNQSPQNITVDCDNIPAAMEVTANDNCGTPTVSLVETETDGCPYEIVRTWTASDACGNSISISQTLTVVDSENPVLVGVPGDTDAECDNIPLAAEVTATDNCDEDVDVSMVETELPIDDCSYQLRRTWTATDNCGNTSSLVQVISITDNTPPTLIGVPADETLDCEDVIPNAIVVAQDNCSTGLIVSLSATTNPLDCGHEMIRTWFTEDACGNPVSATQVITVIDNTDPYLLSAPAAEITIECGDDEPTEAPVFADNCDDDLTLTAISGITNVTDCGYDIERTWSATDDCDNSLSFSQVIHVIDTQAPVITCPADYVVNCDNGSSDPADSGMATATDICSDPVITFADGPAGDDCPSVFERTWTATDACGLSSSCIQLITINDFEAPAITCPADITVECTESLEPSNTGVATATDDCSVPMISHVDGPTTGDCPYSFERTWTAIDPCGNSVSCVQLITVDDTMAPVLTGQDETIELECNILPSVIAPEVSDNCDLDVDVVFNVTTIPGTCPNNYTDIYTWTATDNCGNQTVRTLTFIFSDNTPPTLLGVPADITINCDQVVPNAIVFAQDNCSEGLIVSLSATTNPLDCGHEMIRTWSTEDECGNPVSATQVITVIDNTDPYLLSAPAAEITIECGDDEPTEAPVFADNCDDDLTLTAISGITNVTDCGYDIERTWSATDDCDNSLSFSQVIHVIDTQAPVITCPADYVVNCDNGSSDPADSGMATATDACSDPVITFADGPAGDECPSVFERTWTATDACGLSSSCVQLITINDFTPPVITCPAFVIIECGMEHGPDVMGYPTVSDDCSIPAVTYVDAEVSGGCPNNIIRTWTATDACGNTSTCDQVIQVNDTTPPVITGEDAEFTLNCNEAIDLVVPTVSDICDDTVELDYQFASLPGDCPNERTEIFTWSATDVCGNYAERVITVHYQDIDAPVLNGVPGNATYSCDEVIPDAEVTAEDNCDELVVVDFNESTVDFDCGSEITRVWSAEDSCGNPVSATQVITIVDETDPYIVSAPAAEITIECGDDEPTEAPVFADNCDDDLTLTAISGITNVTDCGYDIERSWSATDDCDNSLSFSQVIHVIDTQAPVITCPADYVVNCDNGSSDPADSGMATATDICSDPVITFVDGPAGDDCPSVFERTWTATDACGLSSSCIQLITINDFEAPVITCPADITVECTESLEPSNTGVATATDDCSVPMISHVDGPTTGDCPYSFERTWTAIDPCGNSASCVQVITVDDTIAPVLTGEDETIELECNIQPSVIAPEVSDNCDLDVDVDFNVATIPGTCPNNYTDIYTWTATDNCGNQTVRTLTFIFSDNTSPELLGVPGNATYSCDEIIPDAEVTANDNCDPSVLVDFNESTVDFDCGYEMIRTWSTEDACGNPVSATQVITIVDETDPYIVSAPAAEITIECGDDEPTEAPVFADNCDDELTLTAISGITNVTDCGYDIERTWSATDDCDNSLSFSQVIHVIDTQAPVITCPADYVVNCDNGSSDPADSGMATATDICSDPVITFADGPAGDDCPSVFERTWTATDACGLSSSCIQLITINDFAAPVITCPADITVECTESLEPSNTGLATATDDCSVPAVSHVDGPTTGDCPYSFERTWTAIDPCGNSVSCVQVITVDDTIAPVLTGQDETIELECNIQPSVIAPEVSDNCDLDVDVDFNVATIPGTCPNNYTDIYTWTATDNCGNQTVRTLTFIFSDNTDPELIGVPAAATVECTDIPAVANVTAIDNCSEVTPVYSQSIEDLVCGEIITRTWTATDECGNSTSMSQVITVIDITDPELVGVPANETVSCDAIPAAANVTATDNCDPSIEAILSEVVGDGCPYTITRTWTATDVCGNSTSETQVLTVIDESDPVATFVPDGYSVECDLDIPVVDAEFTDNCTLDLDIQYNESRIDFECGAEVTRTWTATDACENSVTVTQVIDVIDTTAPQFNPYEIDVDMPCTDIDMNVLVTAFDNCDLDVEITFTDTHVSGGCAGRIIRNYLAVDNCGNEATAQQIITLVDTFDPEATYVPASYEIECDLPIADDQPEWFDNCDENLLIDFSESTEAQGCNTVLTRTWTATDHCLNSTTVSQTITIIDSTDPTLVGLPENDTVECSAIPAPAAVTAEDNCDMEIEAVYSQVVVSSDCPYTIERTWTATDDCGNSVSHTQVLTVIDSIDPVLTGVPANDTVECDNIPAPAAVGYTDNCADDLIVDFNESEVEFECGSEITRTWTVVDHCGNTATATQVLTVIDSTYPTLIGVPANTVAECDDVPAPAIVLADDNCSEGLVASFNESQEAQECGYIITRTWSVTDDCGNTTEETQEITVLDTTLPVITSSPANVTVECDNIPEFGTITAEDNCDLDLTITTDEEFEEFDCGGLLTRTWIATDDCGNSSAISQVITIVDTTDPVLSGVPANVTVECGVEVEIPVVTASDVCDGELLVMFTEETTYFECGHEIVRTWRAADGCGNVAIDSQTITVTDLTAPVFNTLPAAEVVNCDDEIVAPVLTAEDICDGSVEVSLEEEFGEGCPYTITRTWTASDACGNTVEHVQIVTVVDEVEPVFEIVATEVVISCDEISAYMLTATDNCDDEVEVSYSDTAVGMNDPNADKVCEMTDPVNVQPAWSVVLYGMPFNLDNYLTTSAYLLEYPDGTAHLVGSVYSTVNPNGGFEIDVWFENGLGWEDWSTQDFPTSYKDDANVAGLNYLDWTYYIVNGAMATLTGTGDYAGSLLSLTHAPSNHFYGFQVGIAANNRDDQYGAGGWFTYSGQFVDANTQYNSTVGGAGDFAFDGNCCAANDIERTWVAVDNCGNETVFVQSIHIIDEEAPELFNIPANETIYCGEEVPAVPADIYALDNCDDNVVILFSEVQSNEFCPYTITRTWTAVDECGNSTTETQVITVEFEAAPDVFLFGYPNPFNDHFTVQFTVPADAYVVANVYDITGRIVFNIAEGKMDAERLYQYTVNNVQWNAGAYTIMLMVDDKVFHHKMLVIQR